MDLLQIDLGLAEIPGDGFDRADLDPLVGLDLPAADFLFQPAAELAERVSGFRRLPGAVLGQGQTQGIPNQGVVRLPNLIELDNPPEERNGRGRPAHGEKDMAQIRQGVGVVRLDFQGLAKFFLGFAVLLPDPEAVAEKTVGIRQRRGELDQTAGGRFRGRGVLSEVDMEKPEVLQGNGIPGGAFRGKGGLEMSFDKVEMTVSPGFKASESDIRLGLVGGVGIDIAITPQLSFVTDVRLHLITDSYITLQGGVALHF